MPPSGGAAEASSCDADPEVVPASPARPIALAGSAACVAGPERRLMRWTRERARRPSRRARPRHVPRGARGPARGRGRLASRRRRGGRRRIAPGRREAAAAAARLPRRAAGHAADRRRGGRRRARAHGDARPRRLDRRRRLPPRPRLGVAGLRARRGARRRRLPLRPRLRRADLDRRSARGLDPRRRRALPGARRGAPAEPDPRPRHDDRRLPRAVRAQDGEALRGGLPARRRRARRVRPRARDRVPDRRRRPRLLRRDDRDRQGRRHRPSRGDADPSPAPRGAAGRGRAARPRRRPARRRARPGRRDRRARALPRARARVRVPRPRVPERRTSCRGARRADRRRRQSGVVSVAVLDRIETLAPIREKVEAGERLDFEDGVALFESDDLLALGELADLARRLRGGGDEVYFVQNLYLNQTNVCRVKCKFCAFAATSKQPQAYTITADELVADAPRQRESTGFPENTGFERRGWRHTTGSEDLKMIAVSRLILDNVPNVKAYWIMMGMPLAQVALHFGANDVQGTVVREEIFHAAGATTETEQKIPELVRFITSAGRVAVQRDTLYNELRRWAP